MPRNKKGGSGHKKMANKTGETDSKELVISKDKDELYAVVIKNYGNGRSEVLCNDGQKRLLNIPKRFRGRNKWDNMVSPGTYVLVGIRSWEVRVSSKMQKCDLIYVYDTTEITRLKRANIGMDWKTLRVDGQSGADFEDLGFDFDETEKGDITFDFNAI